MQQQQCLRNEPEASSQWKFCSVQSQPNSLTITKKPQKIFQFLSKVAKLIWIIDDPIQQKVIKEKIAHQAYQQEYEFFPTILDAKKFIEKSEIVVIICHQSILMNAINFMKKSTVQITGVFAYGPDNSYHKIQGPAFTYHLDTQWEVFEKVKQYRFILNKQKEVTNFISVEKQIWDSNNLVKTMFAMINQETNKIQLSEELRKLAELACRNEDKDDIQQFIEFQITSNGDYQKTIEWYTKQSFVYGLVNGILRSCKDPTCVFILQPFIKDLWLAIKRIYEQQQQKQVEERQKDYLNLKKFYCYRGAKITEYEFEFFKQHEKKIIQNLGFMSTSVNKQKARHFIGNAFFQIEVDTDERNKELDFGFAYIADFAHFQTKHEEELLFNPLNSFKVVKVSYFDEEKNIYKISLKYGELARITAANNKINKEEELKYKYLGEYQIEQKNECKIIGNVLIQQTRNLEGSLLYCDKFIQMAKECENSDFLADGYSQKALYMFNKGKDFKSMANYYQQGLNIINKCKQCEKKQFQLLFNLATSYERMGEYQKAIEYLERCQNFKTQNIREEKLRQARLLEMFGICYGRLGQYHKAIEQLQRSKQIMKQTIGQNHLNYARLLYSLASCILLIGQYQKQLEYLFDCQRIIKITVGQRHQDYMVVLGAIGRGYERLGQYKKAIQYLQQSERISKQITGQNHIQYAIILYSLGGCMERMGQNKKAVEHLQKCSRIMKQTIGQNHPKYASSMLLLGRCLCRQGKSEQAINCFLKSESIYKEKLGQNHRQVSIVYLSMGGYYINQGEYNKAIEYIEKASNIMKGSIGQNNSQFSLVLFFRSKCYQGLGQYGQAINTLQKCRSIQQKSLTQKHPQCASTLELLGTCFNKIGQPSKAVSYLLKSIQIQKDAYGQTHPEYAKTLCTLGKCYQDLGEYNKAVELMQRSKKIQQESMGQAYPQYKMTLQSLLSIYSKLGYKNNSVQIQRYLDDRQGKNASHQQ